MMRLHQFFPLFLTCIQLQATAPVGNTEEVIVHFPIERAHLDLKGRLVYATHSESTTRKVQRIDASGNVVDHYEFPWKPPKNFGSHDYYVFPHDPERWQLVLATVDAPHSAESLLGREDSVKELATRFDMHWEESEDRIRLIADAAPSYATIRMATQDASGAPLTNRETWLIPRDPPWSFSDRKTPLWIGQTDDRGIIEIRQFPGVHDWIVCFPGIGYTHTGPIVADPGSEPRIELNRPAPFANLRGRVDATLLKELAPTARVCLIGDKAWQYRESEIDASGEFAFTDVIVDARLSSCGEGLSWGAATSAAVDPGRSAQRRCDRCRNRAA